MTRPARPLADLPDTRRQSRHHVDIFAQADKHRLGGVNNTAATDRQHNIRIGGARGLGGGYNITKGRMLANSMKQADALRAKTGL